MRTPLLRFYAKFRIIVAVEGRPVRSCDRAALFDVAMVGGANSYRQMHEFIRIHRQSLNAAFGLELRYAPSYTGLRSSCTASIPAHWRAPFGATRRRSPSRPRPKGFGRSRWTAKPCAAASTPFAPQGRAYDEALRHADQIVLAHVMVAEKSNESRPRRS